MPDLDFNVHSSCSFAYSSNRCFLLGIVSGGTAAGCGTGGSGGGTAAGCGTGGGGGGGSSDGRMAAVAGEMLGAFEI